MNWGFLYLMLISLMWSFKLEKLSQQFIEAVNELLISYDYKVLWGLYGFKQKLTSIVRDIKNKSSIPEYVDHEYITNLFSFIDNLNQDNINNFLRYVNSGYKFEYVIDGNEESDGFWDYERFRLVLIYKLDDIKEYHSKLIVDNKIETISNQINYRWVGTFLDDNNIMEQVLQELSNHYYVFHMQGNLLFWYSRIKIKDKKNTSKLRGKIFEWFGI